MDCCSKYQAYGKDIRQGFELLPKVAEVWQDRSEGHDLPQEGRLKSPSAEACNVLRGSDETIYAAATCFAGVRVHGQVLRIRRHVSICSGGGECILPYDMYVQA